MVNSSSADAVDVLLVEDDPADVLLIEEAFAAYRMRSRLHVAGDGEQALRFLRRVGEFADAPRPGLVLLDLNLPRRNGLEVLAELKADSGLLSIPVVMLTTSQAEEDIMRSYLLHANAYIAKPVDFERFTHAVRQIDDFFLTLARLPRLSPGSPASPSKPSPAAGAGPATASSPSPTSSGSECSPATHCTAEGRDRLPRPLLTPLVRLDRDSPWRPSRTGGLPYLRRFASAAHFRQRGQPASSAPGAGSRGQSCWCLVPGAWCLVPGAWWRWVYWRAPGPGWRRRGSGGPGR
jgi:CheY-like chemotaxis protein